MLDINIRKIFVDKIIFELSKTSEENNIQLDYITTVDYLVKGTAECL